jgi:hypothetical protein
MAKENTFILNLERYPKHRVEEDMLAGDFEVKFNGNGNLRLVATDEESKILLHQCTELRSKIRSR